MKLSEVKAICANFCPVMQEGKTTCISRTGELCTMDSHFVCELVLHRMGVVKVVDPRSRLIKRLRGCTPEQLADWYAGMGLTSLEQLAPDLVGEASAVLDRILAPLAAAPAVPKLEEISIADESPPPPKPAFAFPTPIAIGDAPDGAYCVGVNSGKLVRRIGVVAGGRIQIEHVTAGVTSSHGVKAETPVYSYASYADLAAAQAASEAWTPAVASAPAAVVLPAGQATLPMDGIVGPAMAIPAATPAVASAARGVKGGWNDRWSLSRIECGLDCPRKFYLRYVAQAPETNPGKALRLGSLFHEGREAIDTEKPWVCPTDPEPEDLAKLLAILDAYRDLRPVKVERSEVEVRFELPDASGPIPMIGYLDGIGAKCGIEFKYADPSHYGKATVNRQVSLYLHALPELEAFTIVIATKSKCRLKQGEDVEAFRQRVREGFRKDDPFMVSNYRREDFPIDPTIAELVDGVYLIRAYMARAQQAGMCAMPPAAKGFMKCPNCGYRDFCEVHDGGDVNTASWPAVDLVRQAITEVGGK